MHPLLSFLCRYSERDILDSNENCFSLLEDMGLIPKKTDQPPPCPTCCGPMGAHAHKSYTTGWRWVCRKRKNPGQDKCATTVNPSKNTFFENVHLPVKDVLALLFLFVDDYPVTLAHRDLWTWRMGKRHESGISINTVVDFYCFFREIAEVYASNYSSQLGGPGKTIELDETFLTVRKYGRGTTLLLCFIYLFTF